MELELVKWMIRREYKVKYYLDKLPAGYNLFPLKDKNNKPEIHYTSGIPLGYYVSNADGTETFYVYNHLTFNVKVHYEKNLDKYTIVGFDIIPVSINHKIVGYMENDGVIVNKVPEGKETGNAYKESASAIKDLSDAGKGNVATQESKAINNNNRSGDDGMRLLDSTEEFLKGAEKADNKTQAVVVNSEGEKAAGKDKDHDTATAVKEESKSAVGQVKAKSESDKLCKLFVFV